MAIRSGQILNVGNGFVIDRIQTGGISNFNIPKTAIHELGNYQNVQNLYDIPTLTYEVDTTDVTCEMEALVTKVDPTSLTNHQQFDFQKAICMDIISPFKSNQGAYDIVKGVIVPYLTLGQVSYKFGVNANSTQTFTFNGDAPYYTPNVPYAESLPAVNGANHTYTIAHTADNYTEQGNTRHIISVTMKNKVTFASKRLFFASDGTTATGDFTDTATTFTILADQSTDFPSANSVVDVVYSSSAAATYPQNLNTPSTTKLGALRGKDVHVQVWTGGATPAPIIWHGIQTAQVDWRVTLEADDELGNPNHVSYAPRDIPAVTGNIVLRPLNPGDLQTKIAQIANVSTTVVAGYTTSIPLQIDITLKNPDTGVPIKGIYVPDARITIPAVNDRVDQKLDVTFNWESDSGTVYAYNGSRL